MFSGMFEAFFTMFGKLFECKKSAIENQATAEIIEEKKDYKKATDIAENIIAIAVRYKSEMAASDRKLLDKYIEKFKKVN